MKEPSASGDQAKMMKLLAPTSGSMPKAKTGVKMGKSPKMDKTRLEGKRR